MKKIFVLAGIVFSVSAFRFALPGNKPAMEIHPAIQTSLNLLQKSSHEFIENAGCISCHGQYLGIIAFQYGREKGFIIADSSFREAQSHIQDAWTKGQAPLIEQDEFLGGNITTSFALWALGVSKMPANKTTDFLLNGLLSRQSGDGHWIGGNGRPPLEYYSFDATAMAIYGMNYYARPGFATKIKNAREKAVAWLTVTPAINNEEKAFQLLGLTWGNGNPVFINKQAEELLNRQQPDGGWSQLDSLPTDAYATGQSLFALEQSGKLKVTDRAFEKAVHFLLNTQHEDGSWHIKSRTHPFLPHVSSGFPYGNDQFISAAGSNWATIALLQSVQKQPL